MKKETSRRHFIKGTLAGIAAVVPFISGCIAPRVSTTARDQEKGQPWRCSNCGHLTRSDEDLSDHRCPRCYSKKLGRVTEEEFAEYLKKEAAGE